MIDDMVGNTSATVFDAFAETAACFPQRGFLCVLPETAKAYGIADGEITYGGALEQITALKARYREAGYGAGHRVAILVENRPAFFMHWFALNALGCSVVPINPDLRAAELEFIIGHSEVVAAVAIPSRQSELAAAARTVGARLAIHAADGMLARLEKPAKSDALGANGRDRECALLYTSGTTGRPKGCVLANEYFLHAGHWYAAAGGLITLRQAHERMLTPLPLFHMNAMACSTLAMVLTAGCLIVLDRFHPKTWWQNVRSSRATVVHYLGVMPPMLMAAAESEDDRRHDVRFGFGAGIDRALHAPFEKRFGFPLVEAWAMTETGAGAEIAASSEPRHVGTNCFGRPGPDVEVRIIGDDGAEAAIDEPGELLVRHGEERPRYGFFREYLKDEEATREAWRDGWFHTGDVVRRDGDGSLYFVDRKKNVIRRSGENISAVEVESVLLRHAAVRQAAVAPTPDAVRGDEVAACVVTDRDVSDPQLASKLAGEIVEWCLSRLAYYKAPGYIMFVPVLPLTSTQKIQRGELRALVAAQIADKNCIDTRNMKKRTPQNA
jgi:acyl-CoA synthetase (AMP-forming)/AMP-acid ligase II